ncbi:copper ion binding [Striga hermonthica]|uniref:Copper ion binding n=1 Tax=Striga hermonthica TaxID=68872 RepID=A0A9N7RHZ9_STRHE|nr:copper ion binding [Striga hermonthica]
MMMMMSSTMLKKLKLSNPSLDSFAHQLLQRCSVSGTAKGKAKIKTGQPLKRSKVTTKKGSNEPSKKEGPRRQSQFDEMVDQCLTATSPLRFLKPKEKAREAEREKMGLISKSNEQAKEKLKKKAKEDEFASPWIMGTPGMDFITLGLVDADKIPKYDLNVEDGRRLAKEYSRVLMRKHRARQAAETNLLRLKKEAIEALPEDLRAAALVPDLSPFPVNRFMATLTPPIEGYIEKIDEAARKSAAKEKLR